MLTLSDKYLMDVLCSDTFSPQNSTALDVPWRQQPQNLLSSLFWATQNPSHIFLMFNNAGKQNFLLCSSSVCPISPPMLQCRDAGKGILGFSIQAAPPSSIFQLLPWNPSPPALLAPSALPFPFFLPPLALLWAVTRLQKMLFQALLFHPYIEQELFPSYLCHPKWISLALPSVLYKQKHFGVKMEISHPLESLISSYTSFQARKNKVCLTLRTSPEHKSLFQGF